MGNKRQGYLIIVQSKLEYNIFTSYISILKNSLFLWYFLNSGYSKNNYKENWTMRQKQVHSV